MKTRLLTNILLLAASTAGAQEVIAPSGNSLNLISSAEATGSGHVQYQWYRNGVAISGAVGEIYTIPADSTYGYSVQFKRRATVNSSCLGEKEGFSNPIVITFCNLLLNGTCWADANVAQPYTFAAKPDMYTESYQWNRNVAWPVMGNVSNWDPTYEAGTSWTNSPCPAGWRLPTAGEFTALNNSGSTWVESGTRGAAVPGRFFGPNHNNCTLPNSMLNCTFLPTSSNRSATTGALAGWDSNTQQFSSVHYYTGTQTSANTVNNWYFNSGDNFLHNDNKAQGWAVRCVR